MNERLFETFYIRAYSIYAKATDSKQIMKMNNYIKKPNANFFNPKIMRIQQEILLSEWGRRDAMTGDPFKIGDKINRHHYKILFISGSNIEFIKFDCRISALVPLTDSSHAAIRNDPLIWEERFERAKLAMSKGLPFIPDWWSLQNQRDFRSYLRSIGYNV